MHKKSRVRGDFHARFCDRFGVKFPLPTRPKAKIMKSLLCKWIGVIHKQTIIYWHKPEYNSFYKWVLACNSRTAWVYIFLTKYPIFGLSLLYFIIYPLGSSESPSSNNISRTYLFSSTTYSNVNTDSLFDRDTQSIISYLY